MMKIPLKHPKIIVIDDEPGIREGLRRLFETEKILIDLADSYNDALRKIKEKEYDLYLIDLRLPDGDGLELLKIIKDNTSEAVCIIMTGYGSISSAIEAIKVGAFSYITKPFLPEDFMAVCTQALEHRWYILEARRLKREHHQKLMEIAYEQTRFKTIIQSLGDGVLILNKDKELVFYNPKFIRLLELNKPLMIGDKIDEILPQVINSQINRISENYMEIQNLSEEYCVIPPVEKVILVQSSPILDERNEFLGTVTLLRDITEVKRVEQVKNQFVNMVAHELKAPIAAIVGYLDMISNRTLGEDLESYDKFVQRSILRAQALQQLVNDLLDLSRMNTGTIRRELKEINLSEILSEVLEFYEEEARKRQITLESNIEPDITWTADAEEMRRLFSNFISNGIKYNKDNGLLTIGLRQKNHGIEISFTDTGIGMNEKEIENLFKEFYRAKNKYTSQIPGTGLGLSIAKKIIDQYNGTIRVESAPMQGTTFIISFPAPRL